VIINQKQPTIDIPESSREEQNPPGVNKNGILVGLTLNIAGADEGWRAARGCGQQYQ
jgi:hypothetical protein